jgi:type III secretion protein J
MLPTLPWREPAQLATFLRLAVAITGTLMLAGCQSELYTDLDQRQANEMVATLLQHGIAAERTFGKGDRVSVSVDSSRFADAVTILNDNGLPKQKFATLGDVFKRSGLVSSPVEESAQMIYALSQELSRTVSDIDGVLTARVLLVLPENDPLGGKVVPSSASVFIRYRSDMPIEHLVPQIKMLVANGVAGLSYDKVSVILVPVQTHDAVAPHKVRAADQPARVQGVRATITSAADWPFYGFAILVAALGGALSFLLRRARQRIYPLRTSEPVKSS